MVFFAGKVQAQQREISLGIPVGIFQKLKGFFLECMVTASFQYAKERGILHFTGTLLSFVFVCGNDSYTTF
jgi:hypothetical protein